MRDADLEIDGWDLESGEARNASTPESFEIPDRAAREGLQPGDFAKLLFRIAVEDVDDPIVERMWVITRERIGNQYFGTLDNDPEAIEDNEEFWSGTEIPFRPEHVIAIRARDQESIDLARQSPRRAWPR